MDVKNTIFMNYATLIGKKSDLIRALKLLIKKRILCDFRNETFYANGSYINNFKSIKSMVLNIQSNDMVDISVKWYESQSNPIVTKTLLEAGFSWVYLGQDGTWLGTPYYLIVHKESMDEIKKLVKSGYFGQIKNNLWDIK